MQFSHTVLASTDSNAFASVRERTTTRDERFALGRSLREKVPISALGVWNATQARPESPQITGMMPVIGRAATSDAITTAVPR